MRLVQHSRFLMMHIYVGVSHWLTVSSENFRSFSACTFTISFGNSNLTHCPKTDCNHLYFTLTRCCATAIMTTQTLNRNNKKTTRSVRKLGIFDKGLWARRAWATDKWPPRWVVNIRLNERPGGINPWSAAFFEIISVTNKIKSVENLIS